ncbi:MAG: Wzz/FepE/Etk N-terminal domain-containing protein [Thermodesulfobacteriota bacterium]
MAKNEDDYFGILLRYLRILNRRKIYIIICILAFSIGAVFYAKKLPNIYRASTTIILPSGSAPQMTGLSQALGNLAGTQMPALGIRPAGGPGQNLITILKSRVVAEDVVRHFNLAKGEPVEKAALSIKGSVNAADSEGTIVVTYESANPKKAADIANYYPVALRNYLEKNFKTYRDGLREKIKRSEALLRDNTIRFENYKRQFSNVLALEAVRQSSIQQYDLAKLEEDTYSNFTVLDSALIPEVPVGPQRRKIALTWALIGLTIGILLAFALEALDKRIYEMEAIDKIGMPISGTLTLNWRGRKNLAETMYISEEEKIIRKNIESSFMVNDDTCPRKIVFSSMDENPEKTILICKIGKALSEIGRKVLVINYNTDNQKIYEEIHKKLMANPSNTINLKSTSEKNLGSGDFSKYDYVLADAPHGVMSPFIFDLVEWADITFPVVKIGNTYIKELALHKESLEKITDHQAKAIVIIPPTSSPLLRIKKILSHRIT